MLYDEWMSGSLLYLVNNQVDKMMVFWHPTLGIVTGKLDMIGCTICMNLWVFMFCTSSTCCVSLGLCTGVVWQWINCVKTDRKSVV